MKRIFLIVLDGFGIGEAPDADKFGDVGSNTLRSVFTSEYLNLPNMAKLGLYNIDGVEVGDKHKASDLVGSYGRLTEQSFGKDTTIGHWEIAGIISEKPLPTFPDGFPKELLEELSKRTKRGILCNKPYSGTEVIYDFGQEHERTGDLIVYTSADSVFQIAAHEDVIPIEELYKCCEIARDICKGEWGVGRVIARPFEGEFPNYKRTSRRHDYSLEPPKTTMLDVLEGKDFNVIGIGKIYDIFAGKGVTSTTSIANNAEGIEKTIQHLDKDFEGICFTNLVDFDMMYGHRNDIDGYAKALTYFDENLPRIMDGMKSEDILIITSDHGCDPGFKGTDHSREYVPLLIYGRNIEAGINIGTRSSFADVASSVLDYFDLGKDQVMNKEVDGETFLDKLIR